MRKILTAIRNAAKKNEADMFVYGAIGGSFWDDGGITDGDVAESLAELSDVDTLRVHIDSPGGDAAQGVAIYNLLSQFKGQVETIVEGWAASAASIIMQAGDTRTVAENALVMIHNAWGFSAGNKNELRKLAEVLDKLDQTLAVTYARRSGDIGRQADFSALMDAETWFTGPEAQAQGLSDGVLAAKAPANDAAGSRIAAIASRQRFGTLAGYRKMPKAEDTAVIDQMRLRLAMARY